MDKYPLVKITIVGKPGTRKTLIALKIKEYLNSIGEESVISEGGRLDYTNAYIQNEKIFAEIITKVK